MALVTNQDVLNAADAAMTYACVRLLRAEWDGQGQLVAQATTDALSFLTARGLDYVWDRRVFTVVGEYTVSALVWTRLAAIAVLAEDHDEGERALLAAQMECGDASFTL